MKPDAQKIYHFNPLKSRLSETANEKGNRKLCFVSEEHNNDLHLFLWIDLFNEVVAFQFFFFEKVLDWNKTSGLTTNITNRLENQSAEDKKGLFKGVRTLTRIDDPGLLEEAKEIICQSVFPVGIKDILQARIP